MHLITPGHGTHSTTGSPLDIFDAGTGRHLWRLAAGGREIVGHRRVGPLLLVTTSSYVTIDGSVGIEAGTRSTTAYDARTGARRWTRSGGYVAAANGVVVLAQDTNGTGNGVDLTTGVTRWSMPNLDISAVTMDPGKLTMINPDGTVLTIDIASGVTAINPACLPAHRQIAAWSDRYMLIEPWGNSGTAGKLLSRTTLAVVATVPDMEPDIAPPMVALCGDVLCRRAAAETDRGTGTDPITGRVIWSYPNFTADGELTATSGRFIVYGRDTTADPGTLRILDGRTGTILADLPSWRPLSRDGDRLYLGQFASRLVHPTFGSVPAENTVIGYVDLSAAKLRVVHVATIHASYEEASLGPAGLLCTDGRHEAHPTVYHLALTIPADSVGN